MIKWTAIPEPTPKQEESATWAITMARLQTYAGTVPQHVIARRRAANKVARRSRRINRRAK
jgi:hypothetical protein